MFRLFIALFLSILLLIFIIQNSNTVELRFLLWQFEGSLALILLLTSIVTIIISLLIALPLALKRRLSKNKSQKEVVESKEADPKVKA